MPKLSLDEIQQKIYKRYDLLWHVAATHVNADPNNRTDENTIAAFTAILKGYLEKKEYQMEELLPFFKSAGGRLALAEGFYANVSGRELLSGLVDEAKKTGRHLFEIVGATEEQINNPKILRKHLIRFLANEHPDRKGEKYNKELFMAANTLKELVDEGLLERYKAKLKQKGITLIPETPPIEAAFSRVNSFDQTYPDVPLKDPNEIKQLKDVNKPKNLEGIKMVRRSKEEIHAMKEKAEAQNIFNKNNGPKGPFK